MVRWNRVMGLGILALMLLPSFAVALAADVIYVWTDDSYGPGDSVEVEGATNVTGTVTITITNSTGHEILSLTIDPDEDGEFSASFTLDEDAAPDTYGVNAAIGDIYNTTSFEVESDDGEEVEGAQVQSTENSGDEITTVEELLCAIERAFRFIDKVNETAYTLQEEGYNMTLFLEKVGGLNESLTELYDSVDPDNLEASIEEFRELRKEISGLNGLLNSITKNVKERKALQFTERMMKRIGDLEGNILMLASEESDKFTFALQAHRRKLERLQLTLGTTIPPDELEAIIAELEGVTQDVESGLNDLGEEGYTLKEMYKVQAGIQVFNATVERMKKKGKTMNRLEEKLGNAEQLMNQMKEQFGELTQAQLKAMVEDAEENLSGVGKAIRELNKTDKRDKGGNGKGDGDGGQ